MFALAFVASSIYGGMTVASAYVIGEVTDRVLLPAFDEGATTSAALLFAVQRPRRATEDDPLGARAVQRRRTPLILTVLPIALLVAAVCYLVWNRWSDEPATPIERAMMSCTPPAATPMIEEMMVRLSPNSTEMRKP